MPCSARAPNSALSQKIFDTVIVGGGIIGLFTAWELHKAGQSVCVLERGEFGREASWAAGGILSPLRPWNYPLEVNELALESQIQYPSICEELHSISGIDCEWRQSGMLILNCPAHEKARQWAEQNQQRLELLTVSEMQSRFPGVALMDDDVPAAWLPEVGQVRNPRLLKAICRTLEMLGVELLDQTPAETMLLEQGCVRGVQTNKGAIEARNVVICAGSWSTELIPEMDPASRVYPVKGQMLLFSPVAKPPKSIVMRGERYLVPRADGRVLVGSTTEVAGFDKWTDDETLAELRHDAVAIWPGLAGAIVEAQWAGLRPATMDEKPVIGAHREVSGLYINTGHYRSGIVMAPASAKRMAGICTRGLEARAKSG